MGSLLGDRYVMHSHEAIPYGIDPLTAPVWRRVQALSSRGGDRAWA
ncbi:hypothetical protein NG799_25330 [Laspinema sp. D1]|uniref:Uncharacterized protein n=1 Tax=Laspinema palackyanum D2a TaxID=2953684 RepID=A0ABT2MY22_9CYAN|nr:hypothetical protein [Laspinema sp. D2b]MCT7969640.1 hypothetical protein [Laspinema sp. D2a]